MKLLDNIRSGFNKLINIGKTPRNYRWVNVLLWAYVYLFIVYNVGWLWNWYFSGSAALNDLIKLGTLMISPAAMATVVTFLKINTDKDHNKIPDFLEGNNESNRRERVEGESKPRGST